MLRILAGLRAELSVQATEMSCRPQKAAAYSTKGNKPLEISFKVRKKKNKEPLVS